MSMDELFGSDEPDTPMGPVGHAWKREAEWLRAKVKRLSQERAGTHEQLVRDGIDPREDYTEGERLLLRAALAEAQVLDLRAEVERLAQERADVHSANSMLRAEVERLRSRLEARDHSASMACENPCLDCAGCNLAEDTYGTDPVCALTREDGSDA